MSHREEHRAPPSPIWLGAPGRRAFGWYHAPSSPARDLGVVLCPSIGYEHLCAYRALRHLAESLAAQGLAVLRLDYPGTGEAPGSDRDPHRVDAWLGGIGDAIDELRRRSGCPRVALFGLRAGGTLAAVAASTRTDVDRLALVAPCASGSAFLREQRVMQKMRNLRVVRPFRGQRDGDEEAIGFVFTTETQAALGTLDLRKLAGRPCERALLVPRDDLPGVERPIVEKLGALGCAVDVTPAPGYAAAMTEDPYFAEVPRRVWETVTAWLVAQSSVVAEREAPPRAREEAENAPPEPVGHDVVESAVHFGPGDRLFGIVAEPASRRATDAVIVLNTGAYPRTGASRFGVTLTRALAARGVTALRMDYGGLGDSRPEPGVDENELYRVESTKDVAAAMNLLEARGARRFVLVGLCAGGFLSFHTALADRRARGLVMMNPLAFHWRPGDRVERPSASSPMAHRSMRFYRSQALRLETWKRLVRGDINVPGISAAVAGYVRARATVAVKRLAVIAGQEQRVASRLARELGALVDRGTRVLLVFNGEEPMIDHLERDLGPVGPKLRARGLRVAIVDGGDHVFAPVASQEEVAAIIGRFVAGDEPRAAPREPASGPAREVS